MGTISTVLILMDVLLISPPFDSNIVWLSIGQLADVTDSLMGHVRTVHATVGMVSALLSSIVNEKDVLLREMTGETVIDFKSVFTNATNCCALRITKLALKW